MTTIAVIIVVAAVSGFAWLQLSTRRVIERQISALASVACPTCGATVGSEAARRAREAYLAACQKQIAANPQLRLNFARVWEAQCPQCQSQIRFNFETSGIINNAA
jgi:endogenous inhibitor of DNA gyrase (YacG/DUF329 family)